MRGFLLLLVIGAIGCESAVVFPGAPYRSELVASSEFSEESPWIVIVQHTIGFDEVVTFPVSVENATVTVAGNDGSRVELEHKGGGFYHSSCCKPQAGVTYQLQVEAEGYETVTAVDRLPEPTKIQDVRRSSVTAQWGPAERLEVDIKDDGSTENYYELSLLWDPRWYDLEFTVRNAELQDQLSDYALGSILEPDLATIYTYRMLLHDKAFDGREITLILETYPGEGYLESGEELSVKVRTISEAYYRYHRTKVLQENARTDPFAEPVGILSNVTGGHGVFAGYAPETHGALSDAAMRNAVSGVYKLRSFVIFKDGSGPDYVRLGGTGELIVNHDFSVLGRVSLPFGDGERWSSSLEGGLSIRGRTVQLFHSEATLFRDVEAHFNPQLKSLSGVLYYEPEKQTVDFSFRRKDGE